MTFWRFFPDLIILSLQEGQKKKNHTPYKTVFVPITLGTVKKNNESHLSCDAFLVELKLKGRDVKDVDE